MKSFTDLSAWQHSMDLIEEIYVLTKRFPDDERFGLTSQLRRASTSIAANLAEGFGRFTYPDKAARYTIARGECSEVLAFIFIAKRLRIMADSDADRCIRLCEQVGRMISGLIRSSRSHSTVQ